MEEFPKEELPKEELEFPNEELEFPMEEFPKDEFPNEELFPMEELPIDEFPPKDELVELFVPTPAGFEEFVPMGWFLESSRTPDALTWMKRHFPLGSMGSRYSLRRKRMPLVCSNSLVLTG